MPSSLITKHYNYKAMKINSISISISDHLEILFKQISHWYEGLSLKKFQEYFDEYCVTRQESAYLHRYYYFDQWAALVKKGIPLQYLVGKAPFCYDDFFITPEVLIPRPETEILVELAHLELQNIATIKKQKFSAHHQTLKVAEIGVGSGAVFISLLIMQHNPIFFTGTDISLPALQVAQKNLTAKKYRFPTEHITQLIHCSMLDGVKNNHSKFDLIISNPPYIARDRDTAQPQVKKYEPDVALYPPKNENYFAWMDQLISCSLSQLEFQGVFIMEGHELMLPEIKKRWDKQHVTNELVLDYNQLPRFIKFKK